MQSENTKKFDPTLLIDCTEEEIENFNSKYDELILEPYRHIDETKSKNVKTQLCKLFNYWFELPQDQIDIIYDVLTKVHNMLLLIDDIQDSSYLRRSKPAAHVIYGSARTFTSVNCLNYAKNVPRIHRDAVRQLTNKFIILGIKGQIMETYWRDNLICPTEEQYVDMVKKSRTFRSTIKLWIVRIVHGKLPNSAQLCRLSDRNLKNLKQTGSFFMFMMELFQIFSGKYMPNFSPLCNLIALYIQIMDDYGNLKSAEVRINTLVRRQTQLAAQPPNNQLHYTFKITKMPTKSYAYLKFEKTQVQLLYKVRLCTELLYKVRHCTPHLYKVRNLLDSVTKIHYSSYNIIIVLAESFFHKKKGFCEDISEGKFSFPIIYAVHINPESHRIKDILRMNTSDYEIKKECLQLIEDYGGIVYTENKLKSLRKKIFEEIDKLGGKNIRKDIFTDVSGCQDKDLFKALMQEFYVPHHTRTK